MIDRELPIYRMRVGSPRFHSCAGKYSASLYPHPTTESEGMALSRLTRSGRTDRR